MNLKKGNIVKYTTFCRGINGDGASKSKKSFNILLTKYKRSVLWREAVRLSYISDAWCLKVSPFKHYGN